MLQDVIYKINSIYSSSYAALYLRIYDSPARYGEYVRRERIPEKYTPVLFLLAIVPTITFTRKISWPRCTHERQCNLENACYEFADLVTETIPYAIIAAITKKWYWN